MSMNLLLQCLRALHTDGLIMERTDSSFCYVNSRLNRCNMSLLRGVKPKKVDF